MKRFISLLNIVLVFGLLVTGCPVTPTPVPPTPTEPPAPTEPPLVYLPPAPVIIEPSDGDTITGPSLFFATDENGIENSEWAQFEYSSDAETWIPFPNEADLSLMGPSWQGIWDASDLDRGQYFVRITMRNPNGEEGISPYISINVNHEPIPYPLVSLERGLLVFDAWLSTDDSAIQEYFWFSSMFDQPQSGPIFHLYLEDLPVMNEKALGMLEETLEDEEREIWEDIPEYIEEYGLEYPDYEDFIPSGNELDALGLEMRDLTDD